MKLKNNRLLLIPLIIGNIIVKCICVDRVVVSFVSIIVVVIVIAARIFAKGWIFVVVLTV